MKGQYLKVRNLFFSLFPQNFQSSYVLAAYCLHSYNPHDTFYFILVLCFLAALLYPDAEKFCWNVYTSETMSQITG